MMDVMRRSDRAVQKELEIKEILDVCKVCRLGFATKGAPYIVPMNFGYKYSDTKLVLYFHCAKTGKKLQFLQQSPQVAIEMDDKHQLIPADRPCQYGYQYVSLMGEGIVKILTDPQDKAHGLNCLMLHQVGKSFSFNSQMLEQVVVFQVVVQKFTCKKCIPF